MQKVQVLALVAAFFLVSLGIVVGAAHQPEPSNTGSVAILNTTTNTATLDTLPVAENSNQNSNSTTNTVVNTATPTNTATTTNTTKPTVTNSATNKNTTTVANTNTATSTGTTLQVEITFYGAYDNDPKGSTAISDPVIHQEAGGTGTYADPLTFASPDGAGAYAVGTIIYVPRVQKYFIKEDTCATSWTAPNGCGAVSHVDLYMGNPSATKAVLACEDILTPDGNDTIIVNPSSHLTVDPTPLWNQTTGVCMTPHT